MTGIGREVSAAFATVFPRDWYRPTQRETARLALE